MSLLSGGNDIAICGFHINITHHRFKMAVNYFYNLLYTQFNFDYIDVLNKVSGYFAFEMFYIWIQEFW